MGELRYCLIWLLGLSVLPSCSDDLSSSYDPNTLYDIVSLVSNDDNTAIFQFCKNGDSPTITLTADNVTLDSYQIGERMLLAYIPQSGTAYKDDRISIMGITSIFNDRLRETRISSVPDWDRDHISLYSLWRTGNYINMHCKLTYTSTASTFSMVLDEDTSGDEYPDLYMIFRMQNEEENFERNFYASIDISSIWDKPSCKGVTIHLNNSNLDRDTFTFDKNIITE